MGVFSDGATGMFSNAPAAKENYRSMGRGSGGVEVSSKRSSHWRHCDFSTMPSIPGKFETILYRGNREDAGFGSQAPRFGQEGRQHELPGPGTHEAPAGLALRGVVDSTVGKRGQGPFASKTPRQKANKSEAPGPGFYGTSSGSGSAAMMQRDNDRPTSNFVPPSSVNPAKFKFRPSPGPCDYSGAIGLSNPSTNNVDNTGAFVSHEDRGDHESRVSKPTPGPGSYHKDRPSSEEPSCSRPVPSLSRWEKLHDGRGPTEAGLLRFATEVLAEDAGQPPPVPGPGQYNPKPEATSAGGPVSFATGASHGFRVGNSHRPRKWRPDGPGPCEYDAPPGSPLGHAAASSFSSKVARFKDVEQQAPGPAFYSPRKTAEKDFHLNPQQLWK